MTVSAMPVSTMTVSGISVSAMCVSTVPPAVVRLPAGVVLRHPVCSGGGEVATWTSDNHPCSAV